MKRLLSIWKQCFVVRRFWAGPIVIFIATTYMELWVREKVVNGVMNTVVLVGHLFFLVSSPVGFGMYSLRFHVCLIIPALGLTGRACMLTLCMFCSNSSTQVESTRLVSGMVYRCTFFGSLHRHSHQGGCTHAVLWNNVTFATGPESYVIRWNSMTFYDASDRFSTNYQYNEVFGLSLTLSCLHCGQLYTFA